MSTGSTSNYSLSYPLSTDPVNVAGDIQDLAEELDLFLTNPAFINNVEIDGGSLTTSALTANLFNTNATTLNIGGASTTVNIGNGSGQANFAGNLNIATGKQYEINNVSVLTATTLGSSVVNSSLTSVGTVVTGTWNATTIAVNKGGTGLTSYTAGDLVYASGSTTIAKLGIGSSNYVLTSNGTSPVWTANTGTGSVVRAASPTLSGTPLAPTASVDTNTTQIATTAFVIGQGYLKSATAASTYAPIASPTFTGVPLAPTATTDTNTTQIATTAFVVGQGYLKSSTAASTYAPISNPTFTGTVSSNGTILTMNADASSGSDDIYFTVERGSDPDVSIRWNDSTDAWEFTNDGTTYQGIGSGSGGGGVDLEAVLMFAGM